MRSDHLRPAGQSGSSGNYEVSGHQLGERFGAALAACDLDGDGRDDLVVGAPLYAPPGGDTYETGRVFVYLMKDQLRPATPPTLGEHVMNIPSLKQACRRASINSALCGTALRLEHLQFCRLRRCGIIAVTVSTVIVDNPAWLAKRLL